MCCLCFFTCCLPKQPCQIRVTAGSSAHKLLLAPPWAPLLNGTQKEKLLFTRQRLEHFEWMAGLRRDGRGESRHQVAASRAGQGPPGPCDA